MARFTPEQLAAARAYVASKIRYNANQMLDDDYGFASHVSYAERLATQAREMDYASAVERGEHDGNHAVAQGMLHYLTGEEHAILP